MTRSRDDVLRERERQREFEAEQRTTDRALDDAFNQNGDLSRDWMREILDVDELEERLQPATVEKIQPMLNKQWILSNLSSAEAHDRAYWLEAKKYMLIAQHPPEGSVITGDVRAALYEDETEALEPLTPQERQSIDQVIKTLRNMVARSEQGFERKQINTSIARSETESAKRTESGGMLDGLFG